MIIFNTLKLFAISLLTGAVLMLLFILPAQASDISDADLPDEITINGQEMILVREGWFWRDVTSWRHYREKYPPVRNWIGSYYIAKYEARAEDLVEYMNYKVANDPEFDPTLHESCVVKQNDKGIFEIIRDVPNLPANGFSWRQATKFVKWMGFRLPTEAEWEKAARGTEDKREYPWGDYPPEQSFANFANGSPVHACESMESVYSNPGGRSPYGLYNMAGNIREFVEDWTDLDNMDASLWITEGLKNPPSDGRYSKKSWKMAKGGRWADYPYRLTIAFRTPQEIDNVFRCNGVRYALDVDVVKEMLTKAKNGGN